MADTTFNADTAAFDMAVIDRIHQFNRFGMKLGLERMDELLKKLGSPQEGLQVIHVAGTNGKGSVSKFLEEGLKACGYKMGLYTSPFIERFNERIRFDGEDISDNDLEVFGRRVIAAAEEMVSEGLESPTEFEVVTAIAFLYFKEKDTDIAVMEVGLGGSGDSTNVIRRPLASVICSISYDHMDRLGDSLGEIAAEKAGIIKTGCPVISNVSEREAAVVIAKAAYKKRSPLYDVSKIRYEIYEDTPFSQKVSMEIYEKDYSGVETIMTGKHQADNLKTALATLEVLRKQKKVKLDREKLYEGIAKAKQPGRFEIFKWGEYGVDADGFEKLVILDGAHNEAGAEVLENTVNKYFEDKRILMITGMLADKQTDKITEHFAGITDKMIATEPDNPRKLEAEKLASMLESKGVSVKTAKTAEECLSIADQMKDEWDILLAAGSLYLIGIIRRMIRNGYGEEKK